MFLTHQHHFALESHSNVWNEMTHIQVFHVSCMLHKSNNATPTYVTYDSLHINQAKKNKY